MGTAEFAAQYTEAKTVAWGAPILLLKSKPIGDVCVFLKSGKCSIQAVKPRACRCYPLSVGSDDDMKNLIALKSLERDFHYVGREYHVEDWISANMDEESRQYVLTECRLLREIGGVLKRIPRNREDEVNRLMLLYRYFMFDTDSDFMPQYARNMARMKISLEKLTKLS
jgi:Fe-S-cluster containining protein